MLLAKHSSREVPVSPKYTHHDGSQNNMQENSGWILSIYIFCSLGNTVLGTCYTLPDILW